MMVDFTILLHKLSNEVDSFILNIFNKYHLDSIPLSIILSSLGDTKISESTKEFLVRIKKIDLINNSIILDDGHHSYPYDSMSLEVKCVLATKLSKFRR